jgi:HK97 family phage prohead protease
MIKTMTARNKETEAKRILRTECAELQVREASEGEAPSRTITGYAILFGVPSAPLWSDEDSEAREVIAAEAVTKELLDGCDIKFTMFHDRQLILARSKSGSGTLSYTVDEKGVKFEFDAPNTADGDKALELVRRGDISGCSFAFTTRYWDNDFVERSTKVVNGATLITYTVKAVTGVYDFTLAADPAYPDTSVEAREFIAGLRADGDTEGFAQSDGNTENENVQKQLREMRRAAAQSLI